MTDAEILDANHARRQRLVREMCAVMGWEYKTYPAWTGLRKVARAEATAISLDKLEEVIARLRSGTHAD